MLFLCALFASCNSLHKIQAKTTPLLHYLGCPNLQLLGRITTTVTMISWGDENQVNNETESNPWGYIGSQNPNNPTFTFG